MIEEDFDIFEGISSGLLSKDKSEVLTKLNQIKQKNIVCFPESKKSKEK